MFFYDTDKHNLPHIHADYQGEVAVYAINDGKLPVKKNKLVVAWIEIHKEDLLADWECWLSMVKNRFQFEGLINENINYLSM